MTVAALTSSVEYNGNGVTTVFAAAFRYLAPGDLAVTRVNADGTITTLAYGADYAATAGPTDAGGAVTCTVAPAVGTVLRIKRVTPRSQATDYTTGDTFPAEAHEAALDRAMLVDQEQDDKIDDTAARALLVPDGESAATIPAAAARAGKFLGFDVDGNPVGLSGTGNDAALRTDLAASTGASLVGLVKSWTGAVVRSLADVFNDMPSVMDAIPLVERVKIRLRTSTVDLATYFQAAVDGYSNGATILVPAGKYNVSTVTIANAGITIAMTGGTEIRKYGAGGGAQRGIFTIGNIVGGARFMLQLGGGTIDLNGEGPTGIGVAGRIANNYAAQTIPQITCIAGPTNAAVYALRSSRIDVLGPGTIKNTGETALLFRNSGNLRVRDVDFENVANYGIEFSIVDPAFDGGAGTMPDRSKVTVQGCRFTDVDDYGLGSGNGVAIGGGASNAYAHGALYNWQFLDNQFERCCKDIQMEFPFGGTWLMNYRIAGLQSLQAGQSSFGIIGGRSGEISDVEVVDCGQAPQLSLYYEAMVLGGAGAPAYCESVGGVISADFEQVRFSRITIRDRRSTAAGSGGVVKRADGVATAADQTFTSAGAAFVAADIGKVIGILGAGPSAICHVTTIQSINSPTSVELTKAPVTSIGGATFAYGNGLRQGLIATSGQSVEFDQVNIVAGGATGLVAEPATAAAIRLQAITGFARIGKVELTASANGASWPCGLRVEAGSGFTGKLWRRARDMRVTGFAAAEIGTYTLRASVVPTAAATIVDRAIAPAAGANTYGADEFLDPPTGVPFLEALHAIGFEATGGAFGGGETVTFGVRAYYMDGTTAARVEATLTAFGTVTFNAKQLNSVNVDSAAMRRIGYAMKSTAAGSVVTGKANLMGQ